MITNNFTAAERQKLYAQGGSFIITSRIMLADLLNENVDPMVRLVVNPCIIHIDRLADEYVGHAH